MSETVNLTGMVFCRYKVLEKDLERSSKKKSFWRCQCECGVVKSVDAYHLKTGRVKSCGCLNLENHKKHNQYEQKNECVLICIGNQSAIIDKDDYEKVSKIYWKLNACGYPEGWKNSKRIRLHQLIVGNIATEMVIDHINNNKLDARKVNLRVVTKSQNSMNRTPYQKLGTGYPGVNFNKRENKYKSRIMVDGKSIFLGTFVNINDAINARQKAEEKYFGEYAYDRN